MNRKDILLAVGTGCFLALTVITLSLQLIAIHNCGI